MSSQDISLAPPGGRKGGGECALYCEIEGLQVEVRPGDLTQAGLFVQTTVPPSAEAQVELFLRSAAGEVNVMGQVVQVISCARAAREGRTPGFGMLFIDLTPAHRLWIEQTLDVLRSLSPRARPGSAPQMPSATPPTQAQLTPRQRRLQRERQQTMSDLEQHLSQIRQRAPWQVLGVDAGASAGESKSAFLALSKRFHPHRFARFDSEEISRTATEIFIATKRAYEAMARGSAPAPRRRNKPRTPARRHRPRPKRGGGRRDDD